MEPQSPSPYPQVPATCPYPEPTPSSPHEPLQLPEDYPLIYVLVSPMASFPQASPPTPCAQLYPPPYALHALSISLVSILHALLLCNPTLSHSHRCADRVKVACRHSGLLPQYCSRINGSRAETPNTWSNSSPSPICLYSVQMGDFSVSWLNNLKLVQPTYCFLHVYTSVNSPLTL